MLLISTLILRQTKVIFYLGTVEHCCLGMVLHCCRGIEVHSCFSCCFGTLVHSCLGTSLHSCRGTLTHCSLGTVEHCCLGTLWHCCFGTCFGILEWMNNINIRTYTTKKYYHWLLLGFQINVTKPIPVDKILVVCCYTLALQLVWVRSHRLLLAP